MKHDTTPKVFTLLVGTTLLKSFLDFLSLDPFDTKHTADLIPSISSNPDEMFLIDTYRRSQQRDMNKGTHNEDKEIASYVTCETA